MSLAVMRLLFWNFHEKLMRIILFPSEIDNVTVVSQWVQWLETVEKKIHSNDSDAPELKNNVFNGPKFPCCYASDFWMFS